MQEGWLLVRSLGSPYLTFFRKPAYSYFFKAIFTSNFLGPRSPDFFQQSCRSFVSSSHRKLKCCSVLLKYANVWSCLVLEISRPTLEAAYTDINGNGCISDPDETFTMAPFWRFCIWGRIILVINNVAPMFTFSKSHNPWGGISVTYIGYGVFTPTLFTVIEKNEVSL